jgi:hypothetical protein
MAKNKEKSSFLFYKDWKDTIKDLPDEMRLRMFDAIIDYGLPDEADGKISHPLYDKITKNLKPMEKMAIQLIVNQIDRDGKSYQDRCNKNREIANKRWHSDDANACERIPKIRTHANDADNDNDIDNDIDNDDDKENDNEDSNLSISQIESNKIRGWMENHCPNLMKFGTPSRKEIDAMFITSGKNLSLMHKILSEMENVKGLAERKNHLSQTFAEFIQRQHQSRKEDHDGL